MCANRGKNGFSSSGMTRPTSPTERGLAARAVVAEHVDGGEHLAPGVLVDAGPVVEDPADGADAHAGPSGDLVEPDRSRGEHLSDRTPHLWNFLQPSFNLARPLLACGAPHTALRSRGNPRHAQASPHDRPRNPRGGPRRRMRRSGRCSDDPGATDEETSAAPSDDESSTAAPERDANADLVIWTDALKLEAVQAVADRSPRPTASRSRSRPSPPTCRPTSSPPTLPSNGPDVVVGAHDWIGNLVQNGAIVPLQLYARRAVRATPRRRSRRRRTTASSTACPTASRPSRSTATPMWRPTSRRPSTTPSTRAEARSRPARSSRRSTCPSASIGDAYHMEPILTSLGGYIFAYDEATGYNAERRRHRQGRARIAAAEEISELAKEKVLRTSISGDNSIALFTEGKAAFLVSGPWALPDMQKAGFEYAIQPVPGFAGEDPAQPFMGAQAFMVASGAKNAAFAQEFVNTGVNNEEAMTTLFDVAKLRPAMTAVQEQVTDPDLEGLRRRRQRGRSDARHPGDGRGLGPLGKAYSAIVGGEDPTRRCKTRGKTINDRDREAGQLPSDRRPPASPVRSAGRSPGTDPPTRTTLRPTRTEEQAREQCGHQAGHRDPSQADPRGKRRSGTRRRPACSPRDGAATASRRPHGQGAVPRHGHRRRGRSSPRCSSARRMGLPDRGLGDRRRPVGHLRHAPRAARPSTSCPAR